MNGKEPAVSYDDRLDDILGETYGTMVYQEQVMLISVEMCGFSKGRIGLRVSVSPWLRRRSNCSRRRCCTGRMAPDETTYDTTG